MSWSIGMMTFPIHGKMPHIPNHQPDRESWKKVFIGTWRCSWEKSRKHEAVNRGLVNQVFRLGHFSYLNHYWRVNPINFHETTIFPWFSHGSPPGVTSDCSAFRATTGLEALCCRACAETQDPSRVNGYKRLLNMYGSFFFISTVYLLLFENYTVYYINYI